MGEQVSSAVVSKVASIAISILNGKRKDHKSMDEKIDRLEMLFIKIKSAVEVSETFDISIEMLQEWQKRLKKALSEAAEVLRKFDRALPSKANQTVEGRSSSHDPSTQGEEQDNFTSVHLASHLREAATLHLDKESQLPVAESYLGIPSGIGSLKHHFKERLFKYARVLDPINFSLSNPRKMVNNYLENDEKISKLIKTVEKLEKMAADISDFIELLKLHSERNMCKKRKTMPCSSSSESFSTDRKRRPSARSLVLEDSRAGFVASSTGISEAFSLDASLYDVELVLQEMLTKLKSAVNPLSNSSYKGSRILRLMMSCRCKIS